MQGSAESVLQGTFCVVLGCFVGSCIEHECAARRASCKDPVYFQPPGSQAGVFALARNAPKRFRPSNINLPVGSLDTHIDFANITREIIGLLLQSGHLHLWHPFNLALAVAIHVFMGCSDGGD